MHVLEARATSDCFSSCTSQSTRPTVRPLFTTWPVAVSLPDHTGLRKLILSSRVVKVSPSSRADAYAMPMAASARSQSTPPCTVPSGLVCCGPASISITTRPGSTESMVKPISVATGGGGNSPRCTLRIISSIFATRFLLSPRAGPDGRGYGQPEHEQGGGHGGEDPPQPQAEPV